MIQMLVVEMIIGVLAALGSSAIPCTQGKARQTVCRNPMKQIGIALQNHQSQTGA